MDAKTIATQRLRDAMKRLANNYRTAAQDPHFSEHTKVLEEHADQWQLHIDALEAGKK
jgi:hypothetical protein